MRTLIVLATVLALAACVGPTIDDFANTCRYYGFKPGTPSFSQCIQNEDLAYRQRVMTGIGAVRPMPMAPVCSNIGGVVSCF